MELEHAEAILSKEAKVKNILVNTLSILCDGMFLNAQDYRHAKESLRELVGELFYEESKEAREAIRQHEIASGIAFRKDTSTYNPINGRA